MGEAGMGMYDNLKCAVDLPGSPAIAGRNFQTKSLYRVLGNFTITNQGRLLFHSVRYDKSGEEGPLPLMTPVHTEDIDLDFHGDIKLTTDEGEIEDYVVRFTHGKLEWVQPFTNLSESEQELVTRRSLDV